MSIKTEKELIAAEADDLITAAQALEKAAKTIKENARQLRQGRLLKTWGYVYARHAMHTAWSEADKALWLDEPERQAEG